MSGFGTTGWDAPEGEDKGKQAKSEIRRFWMPAGVTKRVMFLDSEPFCFYEHGLWAITKNADKAVCLKKNGIEDRCPLCEAELWPSYTGYFSVIDMGDVKEVDGEVVLEGWTSNKGITYQFGRKLLGAKRGSQDKPGTLRMLQRKAMKVGGDLTGCVFDVYRTGAKSASVGDEWEFVQKVEPDDIKGYLLELGAKAEYLETDVVNYAEAFIPSTIEDLGRIVGQASSVDDDDDMF